jgi:hypothetical protein
VARRCGQCAPSPVPAPTPARTGAHMAPETRDRVLSRGLADCSTSPARDLRRRGAPKNARASTVAPLDTAPHRPGREALRTAEHGRGRAPHGAGVGRTSRAKTRPSAGPRENQHSRHGAPQRDMSPAPRGADTPEPSVGAADVHPAARPIPARHRRPCLHAPGEWALDEDGRRGGVGRPAARSGRRDHRSWLECSGTAVVSRDATSLDTTQAAWAPFTSLATPGCLVVLMTTINWGATGEVDQKLLVGIDQWLQMYRSREDSQCADLIEKLMSYIEIPFEVCRRLTLL